MTNVGPSHQHIPSTQPLTRMHPLNIHSSLIFTISEYHGRVATNQERKAMAKDMYEKYQKASAVLKIRCDRYAISIFQTQHAIVILSTQCRMINSILILYFIFLSTLSLSLIVTYRVNNILGRVGLTHNGFLKLRERYMEWQEQQEPSSSQSAATTTDNES